jgi:hypothetical protein
MSKTTMGSDKRNAWLRKLDEECPYQAVLPRRQYSDDAAIMDWHTSANSTATIPSAGGRRERLFLGEVGRRPQP